MIFKLTEKHKDLGILLTRIGVGLSFIILHGFPKLSKGPSTWEKIGGAMGNLGIEFAPVFWGFMAAITEFGGGILLAIGLVYRPSTLLLAFTMLVATTNHLAAGDSWGRASHALEMGVLFLGSIFIGPGRYSLDHLIASRRKKL